MYRIADALSGFKKTTPAILHLEQMLARSVDLVVYAARSLEAYVKALRPTSMAYLPNAVNYRHFSTDVRPRPQDYAAISTPIVIYARRNGCLVRLSVDGRDRGPIAKRLVCVNRSGWLAKATVASAPNLHLLGRRAPCRRAGLSPACECRPDSISMSRTMPSWSTAFTPSNCMNMPPPACRSSQVNGKN